MADEASNPAARPSLPFSVTRPVVGMVHLPPLPGAPRYDGAGMAGILTRARRDAAVLAAAGVDGIMVENFGDAPFFPEAVPPETVAALTRAVDEVRSAAPALAVGVNVLRNDARAAMGIAAVTGAAFVRVNVHVGTMWTDQGPLTGRAHETLRARRALGAGCAILADVHVKHASPPPGETLEEAARNCWHRGLADALVVSGTGTGAPTDPERLARVARALPDAPVWVGSGVTPETLERLWPRARGFIVGSWILEEGRAGGPVDPGRAERFMAAVAALREDG